MLRELSNAAGVSGDEGAARRILLEAIRDQVDDVKVDALGNVLALKKGVEAKPGREARVLVAAHMDEVGLMVTGYEAEGALRFQVVGGIDEHVLLGKPVLVGPQRLPGVIGATPVHLLSAEQRQAIVRTSKLRIDLGVDSQGAAEKLVKVGDRGAGPLPARQGVGRPVGVRHAH
ncbi:MAG: hypothetical protein HY784_17455 [Chloroflexi bacterium]|nr:hypothetical protein [Chloroflexota bacterium]